MEPIINLEDPVVKTHGKRRAPDPLSMEGNRRKDMIAWQKALPIAFPPKGVYRFHSHEEADEWMLKAIVKASR